MICWFRKGCSIFPSHIEPHFHVKGHVTCNVSISHSSWHSYPLNIFFTTFVQYYGYLETILDDVKTPHNMQLLLVIFNMYTTKIFLCWAFDIIFKNTLRSATSRVANLARSLFLLFGVPLIQLAEWFAFFTNFPQEHIFEHMLPDYPVKWSYCLSNNIISFDCKVLKTSMPNHEDTGFFCFSWLIVGQWCCPKYTVFETSRSDVLHFDIKEDFHCFSFVVKSPQ